MYLSSKQPTDCTLRRVANKEIVLKNSELLLGGTYILNILPLEYWGAIGLIASSNIYVPYTKCC
jgi:hypothetical protein